MPSYSGVLSIDRTVDYKINDDIFENKIYNNVYKAQYCSGCNAPLEKDVCIYCGTKHFMLKRLI